MFRLFSIIILFVLVASKTFAADIRTGIIGSPQKYEDSLGFNFEYIFDNSVTSLKLRPHIGFDINRGSCTSSFYSGLVLTRQYKNNLFFDLSLGLSVHNGPVHRTSKRKGRILGSRILFRESFSLGYVLTDQYSLSMFIDHISNANIFPPNQGITNIGARVGHSF